MKPYCELPDVLSLGYAATARCAAGRIVSEFVSGLYLYFYTSTIENIMDFNGCLWRGRLPEYSTFHLNPISFIETSGQAVVRDTLYQQRTSFSPQHHL